MTLLALISFAIGLLVILLSAQILVTIAHDIAAKFKLSPLIISLVVVALGTTLPELTVTIVSLSHHDSGHALGNLIGSSIANLTLILGAVALLGSVKIGTVKTQKNAALLLCVTAVFTVLYLLQVPSLYRAGILVFLWIGVIFYQIDMGIKARNGEDHVLMKKLKQLGKKKQNHHSTKLVVLLLSLSVIALALGGTLTVTAVEHLAVALGLSTTLLGMTLTAVSTSLPELLTSVLASIKRDNKVVIGTLLGSNIFNLTLFPAIIYFWADGVPLLYMDLVFLNAVTLIVVMVLFSFRGKYFSKQAAAMLLGIFFLFSAVTFIGRL